MEFIYAWIDQQTIILNVLLTAGFIWAYVNYDKIYHELQKFKESHRFLEEDHIEVLQKNFPFYCKLSPHLKKSFENRVAHYIHALDFLDSDGEPVTDVKKMVLISAYAAEVTFGMDYYSFEYVYTVKIHNRAFLSANGEYREWDVTPEGVVEISWKDFYFDLKRKKYGLTIGVRMMAKVLQLENSKRKRDRHIRRIKQDELEQMAQTIKNKIRGSLFSMHDMSSMDRFFEACIVNFYAHPSELKNQYPNLFQKLNHMFYHNLHLQNERVESDKI